MGFQGHPEASPGPHDLRPLFARFVAMMGGSPPEAYRSAGLGTRDSGLEGE
jgi:hypothetical protein